jgi:glyoxylase-like metal-dependent hydrolase (beta-lactamase superfamily II)
MKMKIFNLEPDISLIDLDPPIPGFEGLLGCYVIKSDKIAILDPGPACSLPNLFSALDELKVSPEDIDYVICSHIHLDHSGGIGHTLKSMPKAIGIVHEKGRSHLIDPSRLWQGSLQVLGSLAKAYGEPEAVSPERLVVAKEGMIIDLGDIQLEILNTPGHASHHISFFENKTGRLFAGESAGVNMINLGGLRPATPNPFDLELSIDSIDKMISRKPNQIYYAHFGRAENAVQQLNILKEQLCLWGQVIADHLNDESDWQQIFKSIVNRNPSLEEIFELPEERKESYLNLIKNNILGYRDYLRNNGTQALDNLEKSI